MLCISYCTVTFVNNLEDPGYTLGFKVQINPIFLSWENPRFRML
jgi:hypothetical protein